MTIEQLPEKYKIYMIKLNNDDNYFMNGEEIIAMLKSVNPIVRFKNGEGFNRAYLVDWRLHIEKTKENVLKHREEIKKLESNHDIIRK